MTFNRKNNPGRDPEREVQKIRRRFSSVTARVERVELMRKLARLGIRAAIVLAAFALFFCLLIYGLGFRW